jgi:hypothetical protein
MLLTHTIDELRETTGLIRVQEAVKVTQRP